VYYANNEFDIKITLWKSEFKDLALLSSQMEKQCIGYPDQRKQELERKREVRYLHPDVGNTLGQK
jgi:hypothetical protein